MKVSFSIVPALQKTIDWIDRQHITIGEWLAGFFGIVVVRYMLEAFSNPSSDGFVFSSAIPTFVHYLTSFAWTQIGIGLIAVHYCGNHRRIAKVILLGLPLIWLGPLLDLFFSGGKGVALGYLGTSPPLVIIHYLAFLTPWSIVPPGLRIELILIIALTGLYVWWCKKRMGTAIIASIAVYSWLFSLFALPSLIYAFANLTSAEHFFDVSSHGLVNEFLKQSLELSTLSRNIASPPYTLPAADTVFDVAYNYLMAQIFYIGLCVLAFLWFRRAHPKKFVAVLRNARPERVAFYLLFLVLGIALASARGLAAPFVWVDGLGGMTLAMSWICTWMYTVHINDIADKAIDDIANPHRPLTQGLLSAEDMRQTSYLWLILSLIGTWTVGECAFIFNLVFHACAHLYSAPPLRLKRVPILSSLLIASAVLCTFMAGFFFISIDKKLAAFPLPLAGAILLIFTLGVNMRDLKDVEGDRAQGIMTLPVLCGRYGARVTGSLFAFGFLLTPFFLGAPALMIAALPAALCAYLIAVRTPYREKWVFRLYFFFVAVILVFLRYSPQCSFRSFPFCDGF